MSTRIAQKPRSKNRISIKTVDAIHLLVWLIALSLFELARR
jgi:hypothetical protein